mmetsp:Transcript_29596/g.61693  ORF Transcript_29596/g.61693 Transcript_29596/m.61693 type:complete len:83 (-) Transcript_29596:353-601(-)
MPRDTERQETRISPHLPMITENEYENSTTTHEENQKDSIDTTTTSSKYCLLISGRDKTTSTTSDNSKHKRQLYLQHTVIVSQ